MMAALLVGFQNCFQLRKNLVKFEEKAMDQTLSPVERKQGGSLLQRGIVPLHLFPRQRQPGEKIPQASFFRNPLLRWRLPTS